MDLQKTTVNGHLHAYVTQLQPYVDTIVLGGGQRDVYVSCAPLSGETGSRVWCREGNREVHVSRASVLSVRLAGVTNIGTEAAAAAGSRPQCDTTPLCGRPRARDNTYARRGRKATGVWGARCERGQGSPHTCFVVSPLAHAQTSPTGR